jgi:hypothetical protein
LVIQDFRAAFKEGNEARLAGGGRGLQPLDDFDPAGQRFLGKGGRVEVGRWIKMNDDFLGEGVRCLLSGRVFGRVWQSGSRIFVQPGQSRWGNGQK